MKKKIILLIYISVFFTVILFLILSILFRPANPKLHTIKIGEEKKNSDVYSCKCEKVLFIGGKNKKEKIKLFCDSADIKESFERNDVLVLFIDKKKHAVVFPLHTYFDDLDREPFYDDILFTVPFEEEFSIDCVFVKRLTRNSFRIEKR